MRLEEPFQKNESLVVQVPVMVDTLLAPIFNQVEYPWNSANFFAKAGGAEFAILKEETRQRGRFFKADWL